MVDPLFQQMLVKVCRSRQIPVIFDEVFSGLWRLGTVTAAQQLGVDPDIACYAKLLTGRHPGQPLHLPVYDVCVPHSLPVTLQCSQSNRDAKPVYTNSLAGDLVSQTY